MTVSSRVGVCESEVLEESSSRSRSVERQYCPDRLGRLAKCGYVHQLLWHLEPDIIDLLRRNLTAAFDG